MVQLSRFHSLPTNASGMVGLGTTQHHGSASEDEEDFQLSVTSRTLLPQVPPDQGPATIPLSVLLEFAVQKVYHELVVLCELLPKKEDTQRKISLVQFAHSTKMLFIRLLALVKWLKGAGKVDCCNSISFLLDQQAEFFVDTADKTAFLAREELIHARLPAFQVPSAVDVLTLGSYPRLPVYIKSRFVSDGEISIREQNCVLDRLNRVIQQRLFAAAKSLPGAVAHVLVQNGMVTLTVPGEFACRLTLLGEAPTTPWTLLDIKILVEDFEIGDGTVLVHPLQVHNLHQLVQLRLATVAEEPLVEAYRILHRFCVSLQVDLLYCQTRQLIADRLSRYVSVEMYDPGKKLVVTYWDQRIERRNTTEPPGKSTGPLFYRIVVVTDDGESLEKGLRVCHFPNSSGKGQEELPQIDTKYGCVSMEDLLTKTALIRCRQKLLCAKSKLESALSVVGDGGTSSGCCRMSGDAFPSLDARLLSSTVDAETLTVAVNAHSGRFVCRVPALADSRDLLSSLESLLESDHMGVCRREIMTLRVELLKRRCRTALRTAAVRSVDDVSLRIPSTIKIPATHRLCFQFTRDDDYYLTVCFPTETNSGDIEMNLFLIDSRQTPWKATGNAASIRRSGNMIRLEPENVTLLDSDETPAKLQKARLSPSSSTSLMGGSLWSSSALRAVVSRTEQRLPMLRLCEQMRRRRLHFSLLPLTEAPGGLTVDIHSLEGALSDVVDGREMTAFRVLWRSLAACRLRLHQLDRVRVSWLLECRFAQAPFPELLHIGALPGQKISQLFVQNLQKDPHSPLSDGNQRYLNEIVNHIRSYSMLFEPVSRFAVVYNDPKCSLRRRCRVKAYTMHQIVIAYGRGLRFKVALQWKLALDSKFYLTFGLHEDGGIADDSLTKLYGNPHTLTADILQRKFSDNADLVWLMTVLCESAEPLAALQRLSRTRLTATSFAPSRQPVTPQDRHNYACYKSFVHPVTETTLRLHYDNRICIHFQILSEGRVALRDCFAWRNSGSGEVSRLTVVGLYQFLTENVAPGGDVRRITTTLTPHAGDDGAGNIGGPASCPPPLDASLASVKELKELHSIPPPSVDNKPPDSVPPPPGSPHSQSFSQLMTPSPAPGGSVSAPASQQQPQMATTGGPSTSGPVASSPAPPHSVPFASHSSSSALFGGPDVAPSPIAPASQEVRHMEEPTKMDTSANGTGVSDLLITRDPIVIDLDTLNRICDIDDEIPGSTVVSRLENYCENVIYLSTMQKLAKRIETQLGRQFEHEVLLGVGHLRFRFMGAAQNPQQGIQMHITLTPHTLQLRYNTIGPLLSLSFDEVSTVERYFSRVIVPSRSPLAFHSFYRMCSLANGPLISALIAVLGGELHDPLLQECLDRRDVDSDRRRWRVSLLWSLAEDLRAYFLPGPHPQATGVRIDNFHTKILFTLLLTPTNATMEQPIILELIYDHPSGNLTPPPLQGKMADLRGEDPKWSAILAILNRQVDAARRLNDERACCIWPAVRDLSENLCFNN